MAKASPRGMAKAKVAKVKVDDEAATATLRQEGTLSHLVGHPTRDLRPVPRRKANENKGASVLTKMRTSPMPASGPAFCAWCVNSRRRGSK